MATQNHKQSQAVRIIGGLFRGRKLQFPAEPGLRPTPDRVRETLFNWLQWLLPGARCLDAFAGSGALGFEACSRGARSVVLLETQNKAYACLRANQQRLQAEHCQIYQQSVLDYLRNNAQAPTPFDVIFLDPPYAADLWSPVASALEQGGFCHAKTLVYLEIPKAQDWPVLPSNWQMEKTQTAGAVRYGLWRCGPALK